MNRNIIRNLRLHDVCRVIGVCFGQRMTLARGCVSDTLPWGSNPTSPPALDRQDGRIAVVGCRSRAKQRRCIAMCRQRAPEVVGHSHADSWSGVCLAGR